MTQWGLSVQQALPKSFVGTLSYVGSKGTNLLNTTYINLMDPTTGLRPYPAFGQIQWRGNRNNSSYQGLVAGLQRTFTRGLLVLPTTPTPTRSIRMRAGGGDSDFPQNPACPSCERASGDFDVRHGFTANAVYELPFGPGRAFLNNAASGGFVERFAGAVLGNWTVSPIVTARTGLPVNVTMDRSSSSVATGYTTNQRPESHSRCLADAARRQGGLPLDQSCGFHAGYGKSATATRREISGAVPGCGRPTWR